VKRRRIKARSCAAKGQLDGTFIHNGGTGLQGNWGRRKATGSQGRRTVLRRSAKGGGKGKRRKVKGDDNRSQVVRDQKQTQERNSLAERPEVRDDDSRRTAPGKNLKNRKLNIGKREKVGCLRQGREEREVSEGQTGQKKARQWIRMLWATKAVRKDQQQGAHKKSILLKKDDYRKEKTEEHKGAEVARTQKEGRCLRQGASKNTNGGEFQVSKDGGSSGSISVYFRGKKKEECERRENKAGEQE